MFGAFVRAVALAFALFPPLAHAQSPIVGFPPGSFQQRAPLDAASGGGPVTIYSVPALSGSDGGVAPGISVRMANQPAFANGAAGQVRVTIQAASTANAGQGLACDHTSIGVQTAPAPNTTSNLVQIFWSGNANISLLTASATATSDWTSAGTPLTFSNTDSLIFICDQNVAITWAAASTGSVTVGTNGIFYYKAATASWNQASVTGFTNAGAFVDAIMTIETQ